MRSDPSHGVEGAASRKLGDGHQDWLVREEPVEICVRDQSVLTMRTPGRDEDLAIGFLWTEGVLRSPRDALDVQLEPGDPATLRPDRVRVSVRADAELHARIAGKLARTHEIRSSCGICGLVDADELLEHTPPILSGVPRITSSDLPVYLERFAKRQALFRATGGCHGAALFAGDEGEARDAELLAFAEDVGRHNALDKAIGRAARAGHDLSRAVAVLSGRAGFDLVLKCLRVRIPVILSVSAASALSHDLCVSAGATLIGFARGASCRVYTDGGRLEP